MNLADRAPRGTLVPGTLGPRRHVPDSIDRPEYMFHDGPERVTASDVKDPETIERIRAAGRVAARAMAEAAAVIAPGVTTDELDRIAHEYMCDHGAYPSCLGYMGFPKSICTSINEVICHGIPDSTVLKEGDLINLDVTAYLDGVHGDTNATYPVGEIDAGTAALIERTRTAMERGIRAVRPGREVNVIGRVIEKYAKRFDYGVVRDYTGHGVGEAFHSGRSDQGQVAHRPVRTHSGGHRERCGRTHPALTSDIAGCVRPRSRRMVTADAAEATRVGQYSPVLSGHSGLGRAPTSR